LPLLLGLHRPSRAERSDLESGLLKSLDGQLVGIAAGVDDPAQAGIDDHLGADEAGLMRGVEVRPLDADAVQSSLNYRVLLGVQPATQLVPLPGGNGETAAQTANLAAMGQATRMQVDLLATTCVMAMKYSSQLGRVSVVRVCLTLDPASRGRLTHRPQHSLVYTITTAPPHRFTHFFDHGSRTCL